jgi:phage minor structural protein
MLLIFDKADQLLTILSNDSNDTCPFYEPYHEEELNGKQSLIFSVPANHPDASFVIEENQVAFKDEDGNFRLFVIRELDEVDDSNGTMKHVYCEPAMLELNDEPIEDIRPQNTTAFDALTRALQNTRWKVGTVAQLGTNSTNFYYESVMSAIQKILNTWGGEIRDRIEVQGNKITGRYIDILARRGADTGKRFEVGKDILSIRRKVISYPVTALYGRGKGLETEDGGYTRKVTFADVEWKKSNGKPVDKPKGQEWVGDPEALALYGRPNPDGSLRHRFDFVEFPDEEDPEKILQLTWNTLQERKKPIVQYELDVITFEHLSGYEHEKVRLGDTAIAIDKNFANPILIETRVIKVKTNLKDKSDKTVTMGNFIDLYSEQKRLDKIETKLNDRSGVWDKVEDPIQDTDFPDNVPTTPTNFTATGAFSKVILDWEYDTSSYIAAYEVYGSQVPGFTPDPSNLLWRGKAGGFVHEPGVNQQWYYKVRAINTHGTPSAYSTEVTATTARIVSDDILFGAVNAEHLADLTVTASKLADSAVTSAKIASAAVGNAAIQNGAITNAKIANAAVGTAQIADAAITNAKIANAAIDDAKIASLHGLKITAGTVTADKLNVGTLSAISADLGQVTAGSLTSNTTIDVETKLTVGTEIQIGQSWQDTDIKKISFGGIGGGANIIFNPEGDSISVGAINDVELSAYQIRLFHQGGGIYNTGSERGFCGVGAINSLSWTGPVAGTGVNFRAKRMYTPSSVTLTGTSTNLPSSSYVQAINITQDGFWLYINGDGTNTYKYWRGYYDVV